MFILLPSIVYLMVYEDIIPLGMVGLVQFTRTELLSVSITALMTGGLGAVDDHHYTYISTAD